MQLSETRAADLSGRCSGQGVSFSLLHKLFREDLTTNKRQRCNIHFAEFYKDQGIYDRKLCKKTFASEKKLKARCWDREAEGKRAASAECHGGGVMGWIVHNREQFVQ